MNRERCPDPQRARGRAQRGDALLEALIGGLLLAILGMGLTYTAARAINTQRQAAVHHIVLANMRNVLESPETGGVQNLCAGKEASFNVSVTEGTGKARQILSTDKITLPAPECSKETVKISLAGGEAALSNVEITDVFTRVKLVSHDEGDDNSAARALLGPVSLKLIDQ